MGNFKKSWQMEVGLNNVPAYQVSGQPFASGGIDASQPAKIEFPYVTRWLMIVNNNTGSSDVKVGFSQVGVLGTNYFTVPFEGGSPGLYAASKPMEVKVSEVWVYGSDNVDVVAGLTSIATNRTNTVSGSSWSGSAGVG